MDDLISRQAAIDALSMMQGIVAENGVRKGISLAWQQIKDLPSAQPDIAEDGTLAVTVPEGAKVTRVLVQEEWTQFGELYYADSEQRWIPVTERLPEEEERGEYLTTNMYHNVFCDYWSGSHFDRTEVVIAWQPLPEPYKGEE